MTALTGPLNVPVRDFDADVDRLATPIEHPAEELVEFAMAGDIRALLALTDTVERHRSGDIRIVMHEDDYVGDHKEYVLRPFAHPAESRFSDGTFGVLYAGASVQTAINESVYWLTRFYLDSPFPAGTIAPKNHLVFRAVASLADIRMTRGGGISSIYDPDDYTISRMWGMQLRSAHYGLWYDSVRQRCGECIGLFAPRFVSNVRVVGRFEVEWNGSKFTSVKEVFDL
ncbi:MAG: RES family NAD+ phosphorylase [Vulcanimicrobiaceae bacterium]